MLRISGVVAVMAALGGCADAPEVTAALSAEAEAAPYPALMPLDAVLASAQNAASAPDPVPGLQARAARLRARAAALQGSVLDAEARKRLLADVAR